ncbi:hypothetical protein Tco_0343090 [Tanacetum coccineum]
MLFSIPQRRMEILPELTSNSSAVEDLTLSWKPCQGGSSKLNLPNHRYKQKCCSLTPAESDSLPHAHAQTTKTFYKHQDSRIKKAQELKTKTSATLIFKIFLKDVKIIKTKIVREIVSKFSR